MTPGPDGYFVEHPASLNRKKNDPDIDLSDICKQICTFVLFYFRCDVVQNLCDPNPCKNDAECKSWGAVRRQCICKPGFTGVNCSHNIGKHHIT